MVPEGLGAGTEIGLLNGRAGAAEATVGRYGGGGSVLAGGDGDRNGDRSSAEPGSR
jgi:hypothetical protein